MTNLSWCISFLNLILSIQKSKKHFSLKNVTALVIQNFPKIQIQYYTGYIQYFAEKS